MHKHVLDELQRYRSKGADIHDDNEFYTVSLVLTVMVSIFCCIRILWVLVYSDTIPYVSGIILCATWIFSISICIYGRGTDGWYSILNKTKLYKIDNTTVGIEGFDIRIHVEDVSTLHHRTLPIFIIYDESRVYGTDMSLYHLSSLAYKMLKMLNNPVGKKETAASVLYKCRTTGE